MSSTSIQSEDTPSDPTDRSSYSHAVVFGAVWVTGQMVGSRFLTLLAHWILAQYLFDVDYGIYAKVYVFAGVAELLCQIGIVDVLIRRQNDFLHWARPGFWISVLLGVAAVPLMMLAAIVAFPYMKLDDSATFYWLSLILALRITAAAPAIIPLARLQIDLKFRAIAIIATAATIVDMLSRIGFAVAGAGPYSLAIPPLLAATFQTALVWLVSPVRVSWNPQVKLWPSVIADSTRIFVAGACRRVVDTGDYFILTFFVVTAVVGEYFWAYNIALQGFHLFSNALTQVFYPTLSKLQRDPQRQYDAFWRTLLAFTAVTVPLCFMQTLLADPLVRILFDPRWYDAIIYIQILSIGMSLSAVSVTATLYIRSQGRFDTYMHVQLITTCQFIILALAGVYVDAARGMACAIVLHHFLAMLIILRMGLPRTVHGSLPSHLWSLSVPYGAAALAVVLGFAARRWCLPVGVHPVWEFLFMLSVFTLAYAGLFWALAGELLRSAVGQIQQLAIGRIRSGLGRSPRAADHDRNPAGF